jgi:hypothetical protein
MEQNKEYSQQKKNDPNLQESEGDIPVAGQLLVPRSKEDGEISEDVEKLNFFDRVRMGMTTIGVLNILFSGSPGAFFIEKITNYANIDITSSVESGISFAIGFALILVGNTVYDKLKRIYKD